eukprot:Lankesteria_metandrocarpae@DN1545_c0_g1_i1.p1
MSTALPQLRRRITIALLESQDAQETAYLESVLESLLDDPIMRRKILLLSFEGIDFCPYVRSCYWKILLHYLPSEVWRWDEVENESRSSYILYVNEFVVNCNFTEKIRDLELSSSRWTQHIMMHHKSKSAADATAATHNQQHHDLSPRVQADAASTSDPSNDGVLLAVHEPDCGDASRAIANNRGTTAVGVTTATREDSTVEEAHASVKAGVDGCVISTAEMVKLSDGASSELSTEDDFTLSVYGSQAL